MPNLLLALFPRVRGSLVVVVSSKDTRGLAALSFPFCTWGVIFASTGAFGTLFMRVMLDCFGVGDTSCGNCLLSSLSFFWPVKGPLSSLVLRCGTLTWDLVRSCFHAISRPHFLNFLPEFTWVEPDEGSSLSFCFCSAQFRDLSRF
jgi:hypothetical protein